MAHGESRFFPQVRRGVQGSCRRPWMLKNRAKKSPEYQDFLEAVLTG